MAIENKKISDHKWLGSMYADDYFPPFLVDKIKVILLDLCEQIEREQPKDDESLLKLTHAATERINELEEEFEENNSELETGARESMAAEFGFIVHCYGFGHLQIDKVIAPRDW
jgi:hypothetical protein